MDGVRGGFLQEQAASCFSLGEKQGPHAAGQSTGGPKLPGEEWTGGQVSWHVISGADRREGRPPGHSGAGAGWWPCCAPQTGRDRAARWEEAAGYPGAHALDGMRGQVESICLEVRGHPAGKETQAPRVTRLRRNSREGAEGARRTGCARGWLQPRASPGVCLPPLPLPRPLIHPQLRGGPPGVSVRRRPRPILTGQHPLSVASAEPVASRWSSESVLGLLGPMTAFWVASNSRS